MYLQRLFLVLFAAVICCVLAGAEQKIQLLDAGPRETYRFTVAPDGSRLYVAADVYYVYDAHGVLVDKIGTKQGSSTRDLLPLPADYDPLIKFIGCSSYAGGHLATCRADGTEIATIVGRGGDLSLFHPDGTGWTNPLGAALDIPHKLIFAIEGSYPAQGQPHPAWSRIAVFDFSGKYLRSINFFNYEAKEGSPERDDARRMWYQDMKVDPNRQRVYVLTNRTRELIAFDYTGVMTGHVPAPIGDYSSLTVLPDGRIVAGAGNDLRIFEPEALKQVGTVLLPAAYRDSSIRYLQADAAGRLYAIIADPRVTFIRWAADLQTAEVIGPRYSRINVEFPDNALTAGTPFTVNVQVDGRPAPQHTDRWQVMLRPADGADLRWQALPVVYAAGVLTVTPPPTLRGVYEMAVRFGDGPIALASRTADPSLQRTVVFAPPGVTRSLAIFPTTGRTAFRAGEAIAVELVRREKNASDPVTVHCLLEQDGKVLSDTPFVVTVDLPLEIPARLSARLTPGHYRLRPDSPTAYACYPFDFDLAADKPDSPMQRVFYHEFGETAVNGAGGADMPERQYFARDTVAAVARLGFTRETDRNWPGRVGNPWRRDSAPADLSKESYAPPEFYAQSLRNSPQDFYLDAMVRYGLAYDMQVLPHCASVRVRDERLDELLPGIYNSAQWASRYPSFYGYNFNDEMFFWSNYDDRWKKEDTDYLNQVAKEQFKDVKPDAYKWALTRMYDAFNKAVEKSNPLLQRTTTPMWQFPAVEGSYAPTIYRDMTESYSHFLSEGYALPFVPAHSADFLRRPGLPHIAIADNGYGTTGGDLYQKTTMQLFTRGVQGVGVSHTTAFQDPTGAQAFRTTNALAKMYGPIFAQVPLADEAAVLYSYTQDIAETRAGMGTPHWERVYGLYGAGLMAGVPLRIVYEEDVTAGWLLDKEKPRVPMLFLVGQQKALPAAVLAAIDAYTKAGGKLFIDAASAPLPGATALPFDTRVLSNLGYASDTAWPLQAPIFAKIAAALRPAVEANLAYPISTDDPWVIKSSYHGGDARYITLATETSPFPWDAGAVWGLGAMYCKNSFTWLPKTVTLTFPAGGVVYDLFDHTPVQPKVVGKTAAVKADLTVFPGRVYAILPKAIDAPLISMPPTSTQQYSNTCALQIEAREVGGAPLRAQIPLRLRLRNGVRIAQEIYRITDAHGLYTEDFSLPFAGAWQVEATEMISGKSTMVTLPLGEPAGNTIVMKRGEVDILRQPQMRALLNAAKVVGKMVLVTGANIVISDTCLQNLTTTLKKNGITLERGSLGKEAVPGVYLALGTCENDITLGELASIAWNKNLLDYPRTPFVPGNGRGLVTVVLAARSVGEDSILLIGGDKSGVEKTVDGFCHWMATPDADVAKLNFALPLSSKPATTTVPNLHDMVGVHLSGVQIAPDGKTLVVGASGYMKNLALLKDTGSAGTLVRAVRVGQAPVTGNLYISDDGTRIGAAARTTERFGQGFYLTDVATGTQETFAGFGNLGRNVNRFAAAADGNVVVTTGAYGAVCWKRTRAGWVTAWRYDYWKEFNKLDWPISDLAERAPQFHAVIPRGADYVLLVFGEFSPNGWVTPENTCAAKVLALNLSTGGTRWSFDVPIPRTLLFPTLYTSPDGRQLLLQVQMGSWGKETYRFFTLDTKTGALRAQWDNPVAPNGVAVANGTGRIAEAFANRLLEVREADGTLVANTLWPANAPISLAFTPEGKGLYVCDDAGVLTKLDAAGATAWTLDLGCQGTLGAGSAGVYAACWDGRVRAISDKGALRWTLDCTAALKTANPLPTLAATVTAPATLHVASMESTVSPRVPPGANLLRTGKATLRVGGTPGWMSGGAVEVKAEALTNGKYDDVDAPWLSLNELFWDGQAGRQVWAEISFPTPTDVSMLTIYENPKHPEAWPTDTVVQVWDEGQKNWKTAVYGLFLRGAVSTYTLHLKGVTKLRYAPWSSYYRNFYTSEIEVRGE